MIASVIIFKRTDMADLRSRQSMFISVLLGGRVVYTGKDIHDAHAWARNHWLNDMHFDTFLRHFRAALEEVGVKAEKAEKVSFKFTVSVLEFSRSGRTMKEIYVEPSLGSSV